MKRAFLLVGVATTLSVAAPASAQTNNQLTLSAKVTSFSAKRGGLVGNGTMTGTLRSGRQVSKDTSRIRFRVAQRQTARRCDVLTLNLQQLHLALLGANVDTSAINLELYARRPGVLGKLFCMVSRAQISFPKAARKLNRRLDGRALRVMRARSDITAQPSQQQQQPTCEALNLILGPLHLDLLGLNVDLYGKDKQSPVEATITAVPGQGLLGNVLCSLAGGGSITSLGALQDLLRRLGVTISDLNLQNLLSSLGIGDLSQGLSQADLQRILSALGIF
jgi:hypothetical protein